MPIDPRISITTPVTELLGIIHPILLAPMDLVADGRLVAAVDAAGGFGILGGGYGEEKWLVRELDLLDRLKARFGVGFITWSLAKQPGLLDLALERRPAAVMLSFGSRCRSSIGLSAPLQSSSAKSSQPRSRRRLLRQERISSSPKALKQVAMEQREVLLRSFRRLWMRLEGANRSWLQGELPTAAG
jgi:NAD(P)H-dependent flavin oxidoreductase YrpB (nitropropane dioxygenase family)